MKNKKAFLILSIIAVLVLTIGVTYAIYNYSKISMNSSLVVGDIYMHYNETNQINITNATPMKKEDAIKDSYTDNVFNFTITGKNTSNKDVYYAISIVDGDEVVGKTRIKPKDIDVYLKEDDKVVVDGLRYEEWNNTRIWVSTIPANTKVEKTINYQLRIWVDDGVIIGNTSDATYSIDEWNNSYTSVKINVNGNLDAINMPLKVEKSSVENNKSFFIATISNYNNPEEKGQILDTIDKMNLTINNTNNSVLFTYKDSLGNVDNTKKESLNLEYDFNKKTSVEVKVYMESINDANQETDVIVKSTKNGTENYSLVQKVEIKGNNFCLNNGFTRLNDCLLVSDNQSESVDEAKTTISNKGSVNLNDTAPSYIYVEDITTNVSDVYSYTGYKFYFADSYEFDSTKGLFKLYNKDGSSVIEDLLSDNYVNYYTCGAVVDIYTKCSKVYKILATSVNGTTYTITNGDKITYKVASSLKSEQGLYKTTDDLGSTYFFRGDVTNNNVYFGSFYWKIIRINGDGTIRLIYNGTTPNATGIYTSINNTSYQYSTRYQDPTYVGYMYSDSFSNEEIISDETHYTILSALTKYYFADSYEYDVTNKVFKLKMSDENKKMTYGTFTEMKDRFNEYPYTCVSTSSAATCQALLKVNRINPNNEKDIYVNYISYPSISYEAIRKNNFDSNVKKIIDTWYKTNIVNNNLSSYIADNYFCNDRSLATNNDGDGHNLVPSTHFSTDWRLSTSNSNKTISLTCDKQDKFSVSTSIGNGKLTYPIALITADEIALAGGRTGYKNSNFYLRADNTYNTMSPSQFDSKAGTARVFYLYPAGDLSNWSNVHYAYGIRPVINLNSNISIKSGDGTMENPYKIS